MVRVRAACIAAAILACAQAPSRPARQGSPPAGPRLPRSSIMAVLEHRNELELDDAQVAKLLDVEKELDKRRDEVRPAPDQPARASENAGRGDDSGPRRGGHNRRAGDTPRGRARPRASPPGSVDRVLDDADTEAYYQAENVSRVEQRERAREIAEQYHRENLYNIRATSQRGPG
jgi:hypothetical protein